MLTSSGSLAAPDTTPGDASLLPRLRRGEAGAFEDLVRQQTPRLLAVARRLLRNEEDARDVVQEAFVSAFRSLGSFQGSCQLSTWLHRIAVNAALMKLRSRRRKPEEPIDELLPAFLEDGHHAVHPREWRHDAESLLELRENRDFVRACIDRLPETYRTVLVLRDIEELDTEEAARLMGVTPNVVKVRLHRARQALRTLLAPRFQRGQA
ncbi:MAG TPA: sigma-70 family RNA polymerase sigma factor [Vicinamibacteria bacterium]|nr:sigma-70 family RNA polymerase sigma factor [Vicinamibacteria bacterium]